MRGRRRRTAAEAAAAIFAEEAKHLVAPPDKMAQVRELVPVEDWIEDEYFVGPITRDLYKPVKALIIEACKPRYSEIVLSGAIGYGKSTAASLILLRLIYELSVWEDPATALGVGARSPLYIAFISTSLDKAKKAGFNKFQQLVFSAPYFKECLPWDKYLIKTGLHFEKNIHVEPVITNQHGVISQDLIGWNLDEGAFLRVVEKSKLATSGDRVLDQAEDIYTQGRRRQKSRFMDKGKRILTSSAVHPEDFMERRKAEAERLGEAVKFEPAGMPRMTAKQAKERGKVLICEMALWEAKREAIDPETGKLIFSGKTFPVEVGDEMRLSRILEKDDKPRPGARIIEFPIEFLSDCKQKLENSLRDIAGVPLLTIAPLITDRPKVYQAIRHRPNGHEGACDCDECAAGTHPFTAEATTFTDGHRMLPGMLAKEVKGEDGRTVWMPRVNPDAPRFIHIDPSDTGDDTGIAMAHVADQTAIPTRDRTGTQTLKLGVHAYVDFCLKVRPPPGGQMQWIGIEALLDELVGLGFRIALVTADTYQSAYFLNTLQTRGTATGRTGPIMTEVLSMDRSPEQYIALQMAFNESRISIPDHEGFVTELIKLEYNRHRSQRKVDHPPRGEKDLADSVCGAVFSAMTRHEDFSLGPRAPDPVYARMPGGDGGGSGDPYSSVDRSEPTLTGDRLPPGAEPDFASFSDLEGDAPWPFLPLD